MTSNSTLGVSSRLPLAFEDPAHVRMILNEVFSSPDIIEKDTYGPLPGQARLAGLLFDAVLMDTKGIESILSTAEHVRMNAVAQAETGDISNLYKGPMLQVSVYEFRWAHIIRIGALVQRGLPVVMRNQNIADVVMFDPAVLRQLHLNAVALLVGWMEAKTANGVSPQPCVTAMSAALMDAFLGAGFLEVDIPGSSAFAICDQPSALQVAIQAGNSGVTQSLLDFEVDLKRLPTKAIDFHEKGKPRYRVEPGNHQGFLDACAVHQPQTVAIARGALMREEIRAAAGGALTMAAPQSSALRASRMGL